MRTRYTVTAVAAAIGIVCFAVGQAHAIDPNDAPKIKVKYDGLDLTTAKGAATLYARLRSASREVCASFESRELQRRAMWKACYNRALSDAVLRVNRDTVTALHQRAVHSERAS